MNDIILSSTVSNQSRLARIVANVVDTQQQILEGYATINSALASLKLEHQTTMASLREDLRRIDDRAEKQLDGMRTAHSHEVGRLLDIIKTLLARDNGTSRPDHQASYGATSAPAALYNGNGPHMAQFHLQHQMQQQVLHQEAQSALQQISLGSHQLNSWRSTQTQKSVVPPRQQLLPQSEAPGVGPIPVASSSTLGTVVPPCGFETKDEKNAKSSATTVVAAPAIVSSVASGGISREVQLSTSIPTIGACQPTTKDEEKAKASTATVATAPTIANSVAPEAVLKEVQLSTSIPTTQMKKTPEIRGACIADKWKLTEGEWYCSGCYIRQSAVAARCAVCGTNRDGAADKKQTSQSCSSKHLSVATKLSFGFSATKEEPSKCEKQLFTFGSSQTIPVSKIKICQVPSSSVPSVSTATVAMTVPSSSSNAPVISFAPKIGNGADNFSLRNSFAGSDSTIGSRSLVPNANLQLFGKSSPKNDFITGDNKISDATSKTIFGSSFSSGHSFGSFAQTAKSIFDGESAQRARTQFAALPASKIVAADNQKNKVAEVDKNVDDDYQPDVDFKPLIPLPDLVQVKSGEENEMVVFQARAKLFRFVPETKENKERGLGDIKILRNPVSGKHRAVMRREQTLKLCANFNIIPAIKIAVKPHASNVYQFCCMDFAEDDNGTQEVFTIKFKTEQLAKEFYDHFISAQKAD